MPAPALTYSPCSRSGTRPAGPTTGTRSGWSAVTRTTRSRAILLAVDPVAATVAEALDGRRRSCWSRTTRCCCAACTGSPRPRPRAGSCTTWSRAAARCSPRTPTPTRRPTGSPSRWRWRSGCATSRRWSQRRPSRSTSSSSSSRWRDADAVRRALADAGAGPDRRLRLGVVHARRARAGSGPLDGATPGDRLGRRARGGRRGAGRGRRARATGARPWSPRCWRRTPTRSRRTTWSSSLPTAEPARGHGRIGTLATPMTPARVRRARRRDAARRPPTACAWPATRTQQVRTVALCGGAGDFLLDRVRAAGADVYLTSDLRHHPASEFREHAAQRRTGAGRRRALGGRVDLAAGAPAQAGRCAGRYGGGPREHHRRPIRGPSASDT